MKELVSASPRISTIGRYAAIVVVGFSGLLAAGCGQKGPLTLPSSPSVPTQSDAGDSEQQEQQQQTEQQDQDERTENES